METVNAGGVNGQGAVYEDGQIGRDVPGLNQLVQAIYQFLRARDIDNNIAVSGDIHAYQFNDLVENPYNPFLYLPNGGVCGPGWP